MHMKVKNTLNLMLLITISEQNIQIFHSLLKIIVIFFQFLHFVINTGLSVECLHTQSFVYFCSLN